VTAVVFVKWQTNDNEVISFNHFQQDDETEEEKSKEVDAPTNQKQEGLEVKTEPLPDSLEPTPAMSFERSIAYSQDQLSEEQLAQRIAQAKMDLARIEAANARKNAQFERIVERENSVELPLLEAELAYRIEGWRRAWEAGNLDAYLSYYGADFTPTDGKSLEQWKNSRAKLVSPQRSIQLELKDFSVSYDEPSNRSLVRFTQYYKSGSFEETVSKRLILASQNNQWKIIAETTE